MPNYIDVTQIPSSRVPFIDPRTGLISREWYLYLFNLYNLTGAGRNPISLTDVQLGPPESALNTAQGIIDAQIQALNLTPEYVQSQLAQIQNEIQGLAVSPANTPQLDLKRYGSFYDTTNQTAAAINTAYAMTFNATQFSKGVTIGSPTSRIYVDRSHIYNIQFSAQLNKTSASKAKIWIWLDKNGVSIPDSATEIALQGSSAATVAAWNFLLDMNAGDYFRLMWSTDDTGCFIQYAAAAAPVPSIPSVILTVTNNINE